MDPKSRVAIEQKLWAAFSRYSGDLSFLDAWLALQCQMIPQADQGWLFAERADGEFGLTSRYVAAAGRAEAAAKPDAGETRDPSDTAPSDSAPSHSAPSHSAPSDSARSEDPRSEDGRQEALSRVVTDALSGAQGVAEPVETDGANRWLAALPLKADGRVVALTVVRIDGEDPALVASAMRHLQWGGGWVLDWLRRQRAEGVEPGEPGERAPGAPTADGAQAGTAAVEAGALALIAAALEAPRFKDAAAAFAARLADAFELDRASVGFRRGGRIRIAAMSHAAFAKDRMDEVRRVQAAMEEALDQDALVALPARAETPGLVTRAHEELAARAEAGRGGGAATAPLAGPSGRGALTIERARPFSAEELATLEAAARLGGAALLEKRLNDRFILAKIAGSARESLAFWLGPKRPVLKVCVALGLAILLGLWLIPSRFELRAPVALEAARLRVISAPIDGYLVSAEARAGDRVAAGDPLAQLDVADLELERAGLVADRNQSAVRLEEATAAYELAEAKTHKAKLEQIEAELALVESKIQRARITAPFDGVLVSGDLSQSIGEALTLGQELFEIAPADAYRLSVLIDERDVAFAAPGQRGAFLLTARPDAPRTFTIERITPVLEAADGRNYYRAEARLDETSPSDRPGLAGRGRVDAGWASTLWIWTRNLTAWARMQLWAWVP